MPSENSKSPYSFGQFVEFINNNFSIILLAGLFLIGGAVIGSIMTENKMLKSGSATPKNADVVADAGAGDEYAGPTAETLSNVPEVTSDDHIKGNENASVTLIEYSDFECPYCGAFHPTTQQILDEYGDSVRLVYRHYPLAFHPNAQPAAETSECVAKIGGNDAFWTFADSVFEANQTAGTITQADIDAGVAAAGVDAVAVANCVESGEMTDKVAAQMDGGTAAGVQGTPGTILVTDDGQYEMISGALPFAQIQTVIDKYVQ